MSTHRSVPDAALEGFAADLAGIVERTKGVLDPGIVERIEMIGLNLAPRHFLPIHDPTPSLERLIEQAGQRTD